MDRAESLYATEEGGDLTPSKFSQPIKDATPRSSAEAQEDAKKEEPKKEQPPPKETKKVEPKIEAPPKEEPTVISSLLSKDESETRPTSAEPRVVLCEDRSPKALWHWAYRKVCAKNLVARIGYSFLNSVVKKEDTVISRLERIEKKLFFMPAELRTYTDEKTNDVRSTLASEISRIESSLEAFDQQVCENFNKVDGKITNVANDLSVVRADLANLKSTVEEVISNSVGKMQDEIDELKKWRLDTHNHKLKSLIEQYDDLSGQFTILLEDADMITSEIGTTIKGNQRVYDADPADSLTTLLCIDTNMRHTREKLTRLDAALQATKPNLVSLKDDIFCILGEEIGHSQIEHISSLLDKDFQTMLASMNKAVVSLKQHDAILAERWKSLSEMLKAVREVNDISSKLENLEATMENKVAPDDVEGLVKPQLDLAIGAALKPIQDKHKKTKEQMTTLAERITKVEVGIDDAAMEGKSLTMTPNVPTSEIRNSTEMADLSSLLTGGEGEVEEALGPMIKNLVEMYCERWEYGSSCDSYDENNHYDDYCTRDENDNEIVLTEPDTQAIDEELGNGQSSDDQKKIQLSNSKSDTPRSRTENRKLSIRKELSSANIKPQGQEDAGVHRVRQTEIKRDRSLRNTKVQESSGGGSGSGTATPNAAPRRGRGRGRDGGGVDPVEIQGLKQEVARLNEKLADINHKKIDVEAVKILMQQKADHKSLAKKVDADVVSTIEDEVKSCFQNIGDLKHMQDEEISELKADLGRKIKSSLKAMFKAKEEEKKGANASVQAICLTCGQDTPMKMYPSKHAAPGFLPALNSNATVGPDVLRGGFKLPVHIPTKTSKYADFLDPELSREISQEMSLRAAGASSTSPEGDMGLESFNGSVRSVPGMNPSGKREPLVRPSSDSTRQYLEDQKSVRPMYKKGFPAKKSSRPVSSFFVDIYILHRALIALFYCI